jgi:hypothetical protein
MCGAVRDDVETTGQSAFLQTSRASLSVVTDMHRTNTPMEEDLWRIVNSFWQHQKQTLNYYV